MTIILNFLDSCIAIVMRYGRKCLLISPRPPIAILLLLAICFICSPSQAFAEQPPKEARARLGYIFQLLGYVAWPELKAIEHAKEVRVCAVGTGDVISHFTILEKASTDSHRVHSIINPEMTQLPLCHLIYFGQMSKNEREAIFSYIKKLPILTVGEGADFIEDGGMVGLIVVEELFGSLNRKKVLFEVNRHNIESAGLHMDPDALSFARRVLE